MRRAMAAVGIVVALGVLSQAAPAPAPPLTVPQKLAQSVKFDGIEDPKATLADALEKLSKLYDVTFDINDKAFVAENVMNVGSTEIAVPTALPAMKNVRLATVLRKVLSRVPAPSGATFCVRADHIEITTGTFQGVEVWGRYGGPHLPLINATFENRPLDEAIRELAEQADFNVVLDKRAADNSKTPVSARFLNTPLDTALRLLADMTDLKSVHLDNVLYVTTKENAAVWEARLKRDETPTNPLDDQNDSKEYLPRKGSGRDIRPNPAGGA